MLKIYFISLAVLIVMVLFGNWNFRHIYRSARDLTRLCQKDEG